MNNRRIECLTRKQFDRVMAREGEEVQDYYNPEIKYKIFYRRTARSSTPMSNIRIYYSQDEGISIGTTIVSHGERYIVYSQDALESEIYFTSIAIRCNTYLTLRGYEIPGVVQQDTYAVNRGAIQEISGKVIMFTQHNQYSDQIVVNTNIRKFGNVYSVENKFTNSGIQYFYLEQQLNPGSDYSMEYYGDTQFFMDETTTYTLRFEVLQHGIAVDPQPPLTYTTSNAAVATIDANGVMTLHSPGDITITCICADPELSETVQISIGAGRVRTYSITVPNTNWNPGTPSTTGRVFTLHSFDQYGTEDTETYLDNTHTYVWSVDQYSDYISWRHDSGSSEPYKIRGTVSSSIPSSSWDKKVMVYASLDGVVVASIEMTIVRL